MKSPEYFCIQLGVALPIFIPQVHYLIPIGCRKHFYEAIIHNKDDFISKKMLCTSLIGAFLFLILTYCIKNILSLFINSEFPWFFLTTPIKLSGLCPDIITEQWNTIKLCHKIYYMNDWLQEIRTDCVTFSSNHW